MDLRNMEACIVDINHEILIMKISVKMTDCGNPQLRNPHCGIINEACRIVQTNNEDLRSDLNDEDCLVVDLHNVDSIC